MGSRGRKGRDCGGEGGTVQPKAFGQWLLGHLVSEPIAPLPHRVVAVTSVLGVRRSLEQQHHWLHRLSRLPRQCAIVFTFLWSPGCLLPAGSATALHFYGRRLRNAQHIHEELAHIQDLPRIVNRVLTSSLVTRHTLKRVHFTQRRDSENVGYSGVKLGDRGGFLTSIGK